MPAEKESRLFAVVGDPVAHSLSPAMHNAAIAALGLSARYVAMRTTKKAFPSLVQEMLRDGGGLSVTSPFKDDAFALEGTHTPVAKRVRAVNCISGSAEQPLLDNTDVTGVVSALEELVGEQRVRMVRLFGTGGAARAAAVAVSVRDPETLVRVVSRSPSRALRFLEWAEDAAVRCEVAPPAFESHEEIYLNAAPPTAGLPSRDMDEARDPERSPGRPAIYLDLNYQKEGRAAREVLTALGVRVMDGRSVLLYQGVAAFERFFGQSPPIEVMRRAIEEALSA
jgi:shikimate dehydrogenase